MVVAVGDADTLAKQQKERKVTKTSKADLDEEDGG